MQAVSDTNWRDRFFAWVDFQKDRFLLWIPVFFAIGISAYFSIPFEPETNTVLITLFFLVGLNIYNHHLYMRTESFRAYILKWILHIILLIVFGFFWAMLKTAIIYTPMLNDEIRNVNVEGKITKLEKRAKGGSRITLQNASIENLPRKQTPKKIQITVNKDQSLILGQVVRLYTTLNPPSYPQVQGAYNFRRNAFHKQVGAIGFSYTEPEILEQKSHGRFYIWRKNYEMSIYKVMPERLAGIIAAVTIGERQGIEDEDRDALRKAGLSHMLAISGLHIGLFTGTVFFTLRLILACFPVLVLNYPIKKIAALLSFPAAVFYMAFSGFSLPTIRAVFMLGIVCLAIVFNRSPLSLRLVAVAAFSILILYPESLLNVSFQMSFAAVTALIYFYQLTRPYWQSMQSHRGFMMKAFLYLLSLCATTLIASLATAPLSIYHFQQMSGYGTIANLLAVPIFGFIIMPIIVVSFALFPFGLEALPLPIAEIGIDYILRISHWAASIPNALTLVPAISVQSFVCFTLACLFIICLNGKSRLVSILPICLSLYFGLSAQKPEILIHTTGNLKAIYNKKDNMLYFSNLMKERFTAGIWSNYYGLETGDRQKWSLYGETNGLNLRCGEGGCLYQAAYGFVSFPFTKEAAQEDCRQNLSYIIAPFSLERIQCGFAEKIDYNTLKESQTVSIYPNGRMRSVLDPLHKKRPWQ